MAPHRWIWWQYHGTHMADSPEAELHRQGRPFLAGRHALADPTWLARREDNEAVGRIPESFGLRKQLARKQADEAHGQRPAVQHERRDELPSMPAGGWEHLSWLYFNNSIGNTHVPAWHGLADQILAQDPDVRLLLYFTAGHPDCVQVVGHLADRWPGRWVLAYHRYGNQIEIEADGAGVFHEDVLWDVANIRLLSTMARARPGFERFRERHRDMPDRVVLQSCRLGSDDIDGLISLAEEALVTTASRCFVVPESPAATPHEDREAI